MLQSNLFLKASLKPKPMYRLITTQTRRFCTHVHVHELCTNMDTVMTFLTTVGWSLHTGSTVLRYCLAMALAHIRNVSVY